MKRGFEHIAALYVGLDGFVDRATAFVREGLELGEAVLVLVPPDKGDALRSALGADASTVRFADMEAVGRNPARIIPVWEEFIRHHGRNGGARGIGEPIWAGQTPEELAEAQRHESLLNLAFAGTPARILCPYDTSALAPAVIEEARRSHPYVATNGSTVESPSYRGIPSPSDPFEGPLPEPQARPTEMTVGSGGLAEVRRFVAGHVAALGLDVERVADCVLAVNELATNGLRYGGGRPLVRIWREGNHVVCEVRDEGLIRDPLVGRLRPGPSEQGHRGLWVVNQICDLVQIRSSSAGSVVRIRFSRA